MGDFPENGVAIVTGGSGGVGSATCRALAAAGCDVTFMYHRNTEAAQKTVEAIEAHGRKARAVSVDLRDEAAVAAFVADAAGTPGGIHTVVTAHGPFVHLRFISEVTTAQLRDFMDADTFGAYNLFQAVLPHLRKNKGSIVSMVTTALGFYAKKDILSIAPKAALAAVVKGIAVEEGRFGVRANMVGVGFLGDGMFQAQMDAGGYTPEIVETTRRSLALRTLGTSEDCANAAVFFASSKAKWVTGQLLMVDGGHNV